MALIDDELKKTPVGRGSAITPVSGSTYTGEPPIPSAQYGRGATQRTAVNFGFGAPARGGRGAMGQPTTAVREQTAAAVPAVRPTTAPGRVPVVTPQDMDRIRAAAPEPTPYPAAVPAPRAIDYSQRAAQHATANQFGNVVDFGDDGSRVIRPQGGAQQPTGDPYTERLIADFRAGKAADRRQEGRDDYYARLDATTPSSSDTWFNFMQKGLQRRALTQAYRDDLEREKLDNQFDLQDQRGAIEGRMQERRIGAESNMLDRKLTATEEAAAKEFERERPYKESDRAYRGALGEQARATSRGANLQADMQEQVLKAYDTYNKALDAGDAVGVKRAFAGLKALTGGKSGDAPFDINKAMEVMSLMPDGPAKEQFYNAYIAPRVAAQSGYAQGGEVGMGQAPEVDDLAPMVNMYRQYVSNTQALGATPVSMDHFMSLLDGVRAQGQMPVSNDPAAMGMPGYAEGGPVDVSGNQVIGPGTGQSDSIPAVVDGRKQAALSSGEFVYTAQATEAAGPNTLKAIMQGLERGDPAVVSGVMSLASKAVMNESRGK